MINYYVLGSFRNKLIQALYLPKDDVLSCRIIRETNFRKSGSAYCIQDTLWGPRNGHRSER